MGKSSPTRLQMKDVLYADVLEEIRVLKNHREYVNTNDVIERFPEFPHKIIRRKLEKLIDAKIIEGCACGCSTGIHVGLYEPLRVVVGTFSEEKGWTDTLYPVNWKENDKKRNQRQFDSDVLDKIKEAVERYG